MFDFFYQCKSIYLHLIKVCNFERSKYWKIKEDSIKIITLSRQHKTTIGNIKRTGTDALKTFH